LGYNDYKWIDKLGEEEYGNLDPKILKFYNEFKRVSNLIYRKEKSIENHRKKIKKLQYELPELKTDRTYYFSLVSQLNRIFNPTIIVFGQMKGSRGPYWMVTVKVSGLSSKSIYLGVHEKVVQYLKSSSGVDISHHSRDEVKNLLKDGVRTQVKKEIKKNILDFWETKYGLEDLYVHVK
jgi:hypothetical protein